MKRVDTIIWGMVRAQGNNYFLLSERPEISKVWQPAGTVRWLVAGVDDFYFDTKTPSTLVIYKAYHIIFGGDAVIEMYDNPNSTKLVEYFSSEDEET